jgi:hypothetical protein
MTGAYLVRVGIGIWIQGKIYTHIESIFLCFLFILLGFFMFFFGTSTYQIASVKHIIPVSIFAGLVTQFYVSALEIQAIGRSIPFIFYLGIGIVLYVSAPPVFKPISLFPFLLTPHLMRDAVSGGQGTIWTFFLLLSALFWEKEEFRAFCYGVACSRSPVPCVLLPFLLIRIWKEARHFPFNVKVRKIAVFVLIAAITFLVCVLIFLMGDPKDLRSIIFDPMPSLLIMWQHGSMVLGIQLKRYYTYSSLVTLMTLGILYVVNFDWIKHSLWMYPVLVLWFSYKGPGNDFFYWIPMLMASLYSLYAEYIRQQEVIL